MCCMWSPCHGDSSSQSDHHDPTLPSRLGLSVDWLLLRHAHQCRCWGFRSGFGLSWFLSGGIPQFSVHWVSRSGNLQLLRQFLQLLACHHRRQRDVYETCPHNAKGGQSPNTHKPLSSVHEEDINPITWVFHFNMQAIRSALTSSTWLYSPFSKDGAISLHVMCKRRGAETWQQPKVELYKPDHRDQVAFCLMQIHTITTCF